jgi:hypothetical protein
MADSLTSEIQAAVARWAGSRYATRDVVVGAASPDGEVDDDATRYLVDFGVRSVGYWQVAEVWVSPTGAIVTVNDLGEGLPLDEAPWPWLEETD